MNDLITRQSREKQIQNNPFMGMPPEQLDQIIALAQKNMTQQQQAPAVKPNVMGGFVKAGQAAGDIFLQAGGMTPVRREQPRTDLNDFILKEMIKAEIAAQNPLTQAKVAALNEKPQVSEEPNANLTANAIDVPGQVIPTETSPTIQGTNNPIIPTQTVTEPPIDNSGMYWNKPIYKNVAGVPKIVGYERKLTDEGKIRLSPAQKKFDIDQKAKEEKNQQVAQSVKDSANDALATIAEVEKGINYFGAGSLIPAIPTLQPEKINWQNNVEKLLSGKILGVMTDMRNASKTGATGFGQLSNKELEVLRSASTALRKTSSPQDAQKILNDMKVKLQKVAGQGRENQGGQIMVDAQGNKAMVYPDGRYEEVQ